MLTKRTKEIFQDDAEIDMQDVDRKPDFIDLGFNASTLNNIAGACHRSEKLNIPLVDYPTDRPLGGLLHDTAQRYPDNIAIEFNHQRLTYKELNEKSNQLATLLIKKGVVIGQTIGLAVDRSIEMVISLLAIMKAGAAYIPLDPEYPRERVEYMLETSRASFLITSKKYSRHFKTSATEILQEDCFARLSSFSNQYPSIQLKGTDLAYILYTSGSTGKPKGVQIEHHSLINFLYSMQKVPGITAADSILAISTISFDISCLELYLPLITGAKIILTDSDTAKDGHKLLSILNETNVTILQATPPTWRMLLDSGWKKRYNFKALCGGEAMARDLAEKMIPLCHSLWNVYGPTETTVWCTIKQVNLNESPITVGKPIDNMHVYILDESFKKVPAGVTGEIFIGGVGMSRGYASRPDLTVERFLPNPFDKDPSSIMYRTGDLGKMLDNGEIQCMGRIDHQVKIRGHRIELGEVEYQLVKLDGVKSAVVIALDDTTGNQKLAAYIVPLSADVIDRHEAEQKAKWREALKEQLPHYMVPTDWVLLKEFPLTPNNKIDKKALPKPQADARTEPKKDACYPVTANEKLIAKIWEAEFNCTNLTLDDNFFELGGHSIIAVRMMNRLEKETGKRLPLKALFEGPTIEKLASMMEKNEQNWDSFVTIKATGSKVPMYMIHGIGLNVLIFNPLARHLDPEQPIYGIQAKGLNGIDKLFDTIEDIAAHYISEITKHNPEGPYALGGYSFGGIIAFEMSKQMKAMGKKVIFTGMFDGYAEEYYRGSTFKRALHKAHELLMRTVYAFYFVFFEPRIVITNKIRFAKLLAEKFIDKVLMKKQLEDNDTKAYRQRAIAMYQKAFKAYRLTPYDGTVDVFRSKKQTYYMPDFKYLGWKPYALKGVRVHDVPGDHLEMFESPNVEGFAAVVQARLDQASAEHFQGK